MTKTAITLLVGVSLAMLGTQRAYPRGCGGTRYSGEYHASGSAGGYHSGGYSGGGAYAHGSQGSAAERGGASYHSAEGPHGTSVEHGTAHVEGAAAGPGGAAAGGKTASGTEVTTPKGNEYTHESSAGRGVAAGPGGVEAGRYGETGSTYHGAGGSTYAHGAAGYSTAHAALPTDAGYGAAGARTGSPAYAGYHRTEPVSGSAYAARGAAVRTSYGGYNMYGAGWHAANPGAFAPVGWTGGQAWTAATWPAVGTSLGYPASAQPIAYDYGNNVTYQGNQVYYGTQPVANADQYFQQASTLAQSAPAPDPKSGDWTPLGVFALVQGDQSDPHYVMQLALNKSGAIGGNYSDLVGGTTVPIQGAVDKASQRVAWTVGSNKNTVGETGLYNLTQDETPALIHLGKDKTQQWTLVRLKQPSQPQGN